MDETERLKTKLAEAETAIDFWRQAALANLDRAERAEGELAWGRVDATMYDWNRAAVQYYLSTRCGLDD